MKYKGPSGVISADELHRITQEIETKVSQRFESMVDTVVEQKIANFFNRMGMQMPNGIVVENVPSFGHRSSCQSVQLDKLQNTGTNQEMDPYENLQVTNSKVYFCKIIRF